MRYKHCCVWMTEDWAALKTRTTSLNPEMQCRRAAVRHLWTIEDWAALKTRAGGKEHLWSPKFALANDDGTW
jgi:hypothetical protein